MKKLIFICFVFFSVSAFSQKKIIIKAGNVAAPTITLTTNFTSGAATLISNVLNVPQYSGGGTTSIQTQNASSGTVTFTSVPATYSDYEIFRNGVRNYPSTDYTTSGNTITGTNWVNGDEIILQRIK